MIAGCDNMEDVCSRRQKRDEQTLKRKLENSDDDEHVDPSFSAETPCIKHNIQIISPSADSFFLRAF